LDVVISPSEKFGFYDGGLMKLSDPSLFRQNFINPKGSSISGKQIPLVLERDQYGVVATKEL
jgi:hypothetical protein